MFVIRKLFEFFIHKNAGGIASLISVLLIGGIYVLATSLGLVAGASADFVFRFCGIGGALLFFGLPVLHAIFKS
jgi:hypothetical protein